jgi:hypothetical protein
MIIVNTRWVGVLVLCSSFSPPSPAGAQIPDSFTNLRVLPKDISSDSLLQIMRGFSFALGVRCQYCHVGGDGISFEGVEFDKDDDPDKRNARFMLQMVQEINERILPQVPEREDPNVTIECKTCHRGLPRPLLLKQELRTIIDRHGVDSAVARYRALRDRVATDGMYDFGEWEMNVLAENLARDGRLRDAIAIYRLNGEFFPESLSIQYSMGRLYEQDGDTTAAVRSYERALTIRPNHRASKEGLDRLRRRP